MRRKWQKHLLVLVSVSLLIVAGWFIRGLVLRESELTRIRRELDASDPGWRLADIVAESNAKAAPPDENITRIVSRCRGMIPKVHDIWVSEPPDWLPKPELNRLPKADDLASARRVRTACGPAIDLARSLRHLQRGGTPLDVPPNPLELVLDYLHEQRRVAKLLQLDANVAVSDRDPQHAWESCQAIGKLVIGLEQEP